MADQQITTTEDEVETETREMPRKRVNPEHDIYDRLTENTIERIGPARYFQKDEDGNIIEDWDDVFYRVASNVAEAETEFVDDYDEGLATKERWRIKFEDAMRELRFMPNTPTLTSAGTELQQLSACFVRSPGDDMDDIFDATKDWGIVEKSGGGMGGAFYMLRPKGSHVSTTGGVSSGPMEFIKLFDAVGETVRQGGVRSGAQMAIMHSQHPDIGRFCVSKRDEERLTNFNISVGVTDEFLDAVRNDEMYTLHDPQTGIPGVDADQFEVLPESAHFYDPEFEDAWNEEQDKAGMGLAGKVVEESFWRDYYDEMSDPEAFDEFRDRIDLEVGEPMELPARFIWRMMADGAYNNGEPGIFYIEETNRDHTFPIDEENTEHFQYATNPCAEQPLEEYEACNLGHVNLSLMVEQDAPMFESYFEDREVNEVTVHNFLSETLDGRMLYDTIETGVRFLDNVVTMSDFPLDEIQESVGNKRKIGLGLMGFAQMLIQLGVEYGSEESYLVAQEIMRVIDNKATKVSHELVKERGTFPEWSESKWARPSEHPEWFAKHAHMDPANHPSGYTVRNHNVTTIAPTGTTSRIGNTTGGCEPIYNAVFYKNVSEEIQGDEMLVVFDDYLREVLQANGIDPDVVKEEAVELMKNNEFDSIADVGRVPQWIDDLFVNAGDLSLEQHLRMQGAFQTYCDSGISKTANAPFDITIDEIEEAMLLSCDLGIKGSTIYRDGSRQEQVNTTKLDNKEFSEDEKEEIMKNVKTLIKTDEETRNQLRELVETGDEPEHVEQIPVEADD